MCHLTRVWSLEQSFRLRRSIFMRKIVEVKAKCWWVRGDRQATNSCWKFGGLGLSEVPSGCFVLTAGTAVKIYNYPQLESWHVQLNSGPVKVTWCISTLADTLTVRSESTSQAPFSSHQWRVQALIVSTVPAIYAVNTHGLTSGTGLLAMGGLFYLYGSLFIPTCEPSHTANKQS